MVESRKKTFHSSTLGHPTGTFRHLFVSGCRVETRQTPFPAFLVASCRSDEPDHTCSPPIANSITRDDGDAKPATGLFHPTFFLFAHLLVFGPPRLQETSPRSQNAGNLEKTCRKGKPVHGEKGEKEQKKKNKNTRPASVRSGIFAFAFQPVASRQIVNERLDVTVCGLVRGRHSRVVPPNLVIWIWLPLSVLSFFPLSLVSRCIWVWMVIWG